MVYSSRKLLFTILSSVCLNESCIRVLALLNMLEQVKTVLRSSVKGKDWITVILIVKKLILPLTFTKLGRIQILKTKNLVEDLIVFLANAQATLISNTKDTTLLSKINNVIFVGNQQQAVALRNHLILILRNLTWDSESKMYISSYLGMCILTYIFEFY